MQTKGDFASIAFMGTPAQPASVALWLRLGSNSYTNTTRSVATIWRGWKRMRENVKNAHEPKGTAREHLGSVAAVKQNVATDANKDRWLSPRESFCVML